MKEARDKIIEIGKPDNFDPEFGLIIKHWPSLCFPLFHIVWKSTGDMIKGIGGFSDPLIAEYYVKRWRKDLIDKEIENILLINN